MLSASLLPTAWPRRALRCSLWCPPAQRPIRRGGRREAMALRAARPVMMPRAVVAPRAMSIRRGLVVMAAAPTTTKMAKEAKQKMEKSVSKVAEDFATLRTGRADPRMLDRIEVEYYGAMTPLNGVAAVSVADATTLSIQPYDLSALAAIERAIMASDLGITPRNDGKVIRLSIPPLTAERRTELGKQAGKFGEEGKVALRNIRRDILKQLEKDAKSKDSPISEDEKKAIEKEVQGVTDEMVKKIDELVSQKQKELAKV